MSSLFEAWLKEKEVLEHYKKIKPEFFVVPAVSEKELLSRIGITFSFPPRPQGYIRFYFQDFIVEEVSKEGIVSEVEPKEKRAKAPPSFPCHIGCNLIKVGISTFDALNLLADTLRIKIRRITYAGLKDLNALTSQKIIFLDLNQEIFEKTKKLSLDNLFLTNFSIEKKGLLRGDLLGNRFSLFVRTKEKVDERIFLQNINRIEKEGFLNFYSVQRFGTPRFISHLLGKLILEGKYKEAILNFFANPGLQEIPLLNEKRKEAKKCFGKWERMEKVFSELPFTFRNELQLLSFLKENPEDFTGALIFFKDQAKFWIYSYASYLFNQLLSLEKLELPEKISLFLSDDERDVKIFRFWLKKDRTIDFKKNIKPFKFLRLKRRFVKSKIFPKEISFKIFPEGVAISFILEKGVYATTFLMNLFQIKEGLPLPDWIKKKEYDVKEILSIGSIKETRKVFEKILFHPISK